MSELSWGPSHFLVSVTYAGPQGIATRTQYHVPRALDIVSFPADDQDPDNIVWIVAGTVRSVLWTDDGIYVDVTMGEELDAQMRTERVGGLRLNAGKIDTPKSRCEPTPTHIVAEAREFASAHHDPEPTWNIRRCRSSAATSSAAEVDKPYEIGSPHHPATWKVSLGGSSN